MIPDREFYREFWSRLSGPIEPDCIPTTWWFWFRAQSGCATCALPMQTVPLGSTKLYPKYFYYSLERFRIQFRTSVRNLESKDSLIKESKCSEFLDERFIHNEVAILYLAAFVRWTLSAKPLPGYEQYVQTTARLCASFCSGARSAESTRSKFRHSEQNFINENDWVNSIVFMALSAAIIAKWCCSCAKSIWRSSPAKSMNVSAQTEFCSYIPDALGGTKITITDRLQTLWVQIRC